MYKRRNERARSVILILALFAPVIATNASAQAWLDPNWPYRLPLTIDNTAGPNGLTDYATRIELDAGNFDFSLARNRGQDIRFTDSDGVTLIDFWIEDFNSTTDTATLWAEAPSVPALTSLEIYMYFGNPLAEDVSSGDATFELYDDFSVVSSGLFGNWQRVLVDGSFDGAHNVVVEDVDGDTKPDLVADAYRANDVVWYRQPADPINGAWVKYTIDSDLPNVHDSQVGDIDGDGQNDVVSVSLSENWQDYNQGNGSLVWYKKPLDPTAAGANGWTIKQSCPSATGDGAAAVYNGELYVFGGHYLGVSDPRAESYAYNPQTDTWRQLTDMPTARWGQVGVEFNGKIHVFAGNTISGSTNIHEVYDISANTWSTGVNVPTELANQGLMGIRYSDKIHLFYKQYHFEYDPVTDTYIPKANVPTPRTWTTCALVSGKIYLIGGYSYGSPSGATNVNERYDPNTDSWTTLTPMPVSKYGVTRDNPVIDGIIYVTHGLDGGFHTDNYAYDPATDSWQQKSSGYNPRDGIECGVINNKLYVSRGRDDYINGGTGTSYLEEYDPAADVPMVWTKTTIATSGDTGLLGSRSLGLGDIDSDGDLDVAVAVDAQTYQSTGRLFWYENPGGSNTLDPNLWNEYLIDDTQGCGADAKIADIDKDGNPDIVYAGNTGSPASLFVYFGPNDPTIIGEWTRVELTGNTYHVDIVDFDSDGDLDILRASALSDLVSWLENPYPTDPRNPANWNEYIIEQDPTIHVANQVQAADIDGDGDLDIGMDSDPSGSTGYFKWYRRPDNPRDVNQYEIYVIDSNPAYTAYAHDSYLADIDGDGDIDMAGVGANANTVMWWVNGETVSEIDPNKWINGGAMVSGSTAVISNPATYLRSQQDFLYKALRCKGKFETYDNYGYIGFNSGVLNVGADDATFVCFGNSTVRSITSAASTWTWGYTQTEGTDWHIWDVLWQQNQADFLVDDQLRYSHTTNVPTIPLSAQINSYSGSPTIKADWILVRKYTYPEPTVSASAIQPYSPAPLIYSEPVTLAVADQPYNYDVDALGNPPPAYSLTTAPDGMVIDMNSGLIEWTPTVSQTGINHVAVEANNIHGSDTQDFDVNVVPWIVPQIISSPVNDVTVYELYSYDVEATGIPAPVYGLVSAPAGMTIDVNTGLIQWVPTETQLGTTAVTVSATNAGGTDTQDFTIEVSGIAPLIVSSPPANVILPGQLYTYDVNATGIPAPMYALPVAPVGMTVDANTGFLMWTPGPNQTGDNPVTVEVTNSAGFDSQNFTITVLEHFDANDWSYRMRITVDNTSGPNILTNYPIRIDLDSNNFDFSKAQADGNDIRFTNIDGVTPIDYWMEEFNSVGQSAILWAEVPHIPASASTYAYMYFGNSSVDTISNGDATFELFDDFSSQGHSILQGDWLRVVVDNNFDGSHNVVADDVDGDGKLDLVADAYRASQVVWYRQPTDPINDLWDKYTIDSWLANAHDCYVGEIDGDGRRDVIALGLSDDWRDYTFGNGTLAWYKKPADPTGQWTKIVIASSGTEGLLGARSMGLGDIDSDGDTDIALAVDGRGYRGAGRLFWYQNPGGSNALDPNLWNEYLIDDTVGNGADAQIGDIDNDGNPDIVYAGNAGYQGTFVFFAPDNPALVAEWTIISIAANVYHVHIVDFDEDGDLDVLRASAYSQLVSWLENPYPTDPRNPANWSEYIIEQDPTIYVANRVSTADIDGDGDLDIGMDSDPSGSTGYFKWYRRPDNPRDVNQYEIYVIDSDPAYTAYAHDSYLADIDNDGDIDMAGVGPNARTVMWWVNGETMIAVDPNKWNSSGVNVAGGVATINMGGAYIRSQGQFLYKAIRCKGRFESYADYGQMGFNLDTDNVGTNDAAFVCFGTPKVSSITSSGSAYTWGYDFDEGTDWKVWEILWQEGTANFYVDDVLRQTHTSNVPSIALPVTISAYSGDPTINVDWILVRKYSAVEPQIVTGPIEPIVFPEDNFDDNRRGALWRYSCTNYFAVSLVEDSNRLNLISAGDANDSDAFYASNGWRFDPNEDFGLQVDFHFDHSGQDDSWVGLVVEDENNLILVSAGCENGDPYYWYEAITDTHTLRERLPRSSTDGKFSIWYEADSNNLYMSHSGSDLADPCATPRSVTCVSNSSFRLLLGGGSDGAVLSMGESFLDNFMVTYAVLTDWPPMTDLDQDGFIGYGDLFILCDHWLDRLSEAVYFDFVWDGTIDFSDFAALAASWLQADHAIDVVPIPAGDGIVDTFEFAVFSTYWLAEVPIQTVLVGDFNYDGAVDFLDWAEFALAW